MDIVVQPAVSWMDLNEDIKASGLFFPVDPGPSVCAVSKITTISLWPILLIGRENLYRQKSGVW